LKESIVDDLRSEIALLQEQLKDKDKQLARSRERCTSLSESFKTRSSKENTLTEALSKKDAQIRALTEKLELAQTQAQAKHESLTEALAEEKKNAQIKAKEYSGKLQKAKSLIEQYKSIANSAVDRYIDTKATMLGLSISDIKGRLTENYTFEDIDRVCEQVQGYSLAMSKLPIDLGKTKKVKVTESKEPIKPKGFNYDDEVDDSLLRLAGLMSD
jgi:chromosome segregation ATPase